jgi:hypothetical protein
MGIQKRLLFINGLFNYRGAITAAGDPGFEGVNSFKCQVFT